MRSLLLAVGTILFSAQAGAVEPVPIQTTEATAALLAAACSGCHASAATDDGFPPVYRLSAEEIRDALLAFRSGERQGTVMNRIAKGYSDEEIAILSDYLSVQEPDN